MFALIRQYEGLDAKTRETATRKANDELRPLLTKSPGFVSYELLKPDGTDSAVTSISVFESRAQAEASQTIARDWVRKNLPSMTPPRNVAGELVAH
jgi:heme-degrading monooxygenase HmoA